MVFSYTMTICFVSLGWLSAPAALTAVMRISTVAPGIEFVQRAGEVPPGRLDLKTGKFFSVAMRIARQRVALS